MTIAMAGGRLPSSPPAICATWAEQVDGSQQLELTGVNPAVAEARRTFLQHARNGENAFVSGAVMALETASDSWLFTLLRSDMPGYHVALGFSFVPLLATIRADELVHVPLEVVVDPPQDPTWRILHPALAKQAAEIVCPDAATGADACARLAGQPGVMDYLLALGNTFSLTDIEQFARMGQSESSVVVAAAHGFQGEDHWLYRIRLSQRAIASAERLAVTYARARARHASGLGDHPIRHALTEQQREYHDRQIGRFAHHLAVLDLCWQFGIGLSSCPMSRSDDSLLDDVEDEGDEWDTQPWPVAAPWEGAGT
jgi:hypothetical protein